MSDQVVERIDNEAAVEAIKAAAHTDEAGRTTIHTFAGGGFIFMGADWDLEPAIEFAISAEDVGWCDHPLVHDLAIKGSDGRVIFFDIPNPSRKRGD